MRGEAFATTRNHGQRLSLRGGLMLRIAVIGAGIVGASVAFRLARSREARVWVVDQSLPGSGTTSASFAWANANAKTPRDYFELNRGGLEEQDRKSVV